MFFLHPMWDSEGQRIGMLKCTPSGYALRQIGELIGFLGLLALSGTVAYMIYLAFTGSFTVSSWLLLAIPFGMGMLSEIMVQVSWRMARRQGYEYDSETREASWLENGKRVYFNYSKQDAPSNKEKL